MIYYTVTGRIINLLTQEGGVPAGTAEYSGMLSYCPSWPFVTDSHLLKYSNRPDAETFNAAGNSAAEVSGNFDITNIIKGSPSIKGIKLQVTCHRDSGFLPSPET